MAKHSRVVRVHIGAPIARKHLSGRSISYGTLRHMRIESLSNVYLAALVLAGQMFYVDIKRSAQESLLKSIDDILILEGSCHPVDQTEPQREGLNDVENSGVTTDLIDSSQIGEISTTILVVPQCGGSSDGSIVARQSGDEDTAESELSSPQSNADQSATISKDDRALDTAIVAQQADETGRLSQGASSRTTGPTTSEINPGSGAQHVDLPDFPMLGDSFISEIYLDDFDLRGVTDLMFDFSTNTIISPPSAEPCILLDPSRRVAPVSLFFDAPESLPQYQSSYDTPHLFRCSDDGATAVNNAFAKAKGTAISTSDSICLSRNQISRWINAYFEHFDIHTPIVHQPTFILSATPASLLLGMLAIGGCIVSEHGPASKAYEASCHLLVQYEQDLLQSSISELWPIQTALLCIQFGAFSANPRYARQAQRQFSLVTDLLRAVEMQVRGVQSAQDPDWKDWIFIETLSRLASWTCILNAAISLLDPESTCIAAPQVTAEMIVPSNDSLWRAPSAEEWAHNKEWQAYKPVNLVETSRRVFTGEYPAVAMSSFGLLTLIGALVANICARERYSPEMAPVLDREYCAKMERSLQAWETLWRSHPHAEGTQSMKSDPMMTECLCLLSSAYHHLYMGQELQVLKRIAKEPQHHLAIPNLPTERKVLVVIKYAATSWLADTLTGIAHRQRKAAFEFGGLGPMVAYETALIVSWWLSLRQSLTSPPSVSVLEGEKESLDAIDHLFQDILKELDEQCISFDGDRSDLASRALFHYQVLLGQWAWPYTNAMNHALQAFASRLSQGEV
ncbi:hypothetical protein CTAM01_05046 [Colletotrichum tamarilloi]|uniref:Xylanolytic transcriptional activator regulatory domain-containing protein n=1 Tax=Colletotrichum tamarilloi TaxID=1209934 RepID=A0ABQ9RGI3_9PEZI|nr:uncharacterized protein CTAM01_05046 [Colletotrichum tamarilloi]KAK1503057.1 hypothetical protein CTAM01_05046 [Colletotrichum tamarilloi]